MEIFVQKLKYFQVPPKTGNLSIQTIVFFTLHLTVFLSFESSPIHMNQISSQNASFHEEIRNTFFLFIRVK